MERQQKGLQVGFWNVNGLFSEEKASNHLLQNDIKYNVLFLGKTGQ